VLDVSLKDVALREALDYLTETAPMNVIVDHDALKGVALDRPVNLRLKKVPYRTALKHVLRQAGLGYTIEDDILIITTAEVAKGTMVRKVYPVADLVGDGQGELIPMVQLPGGMGGAPGGAGLGALGGGMGALGALGGQAGAPGVGGMGALGGGLGQFGGGALGVFGGGMGFQGGMAVGQQWFHLGEHQLVQVITKTVGPTTWVEQGGPGSIAYLPRGGSLVVSQSSEIQDQIQTLIEELRAAKKKQEEEGMMNREAGVG
jgi:hypothetical protein